MAATTSIKKKKKKEEQLYNPYGTPFDVNPDLLDINKVLKEDPSKVIKTTIPGQEKKDVKLTNPEYISNEKGKASGLIMPDGKVFTGITKKDMNSLLKSRQPSNQLFDTQNIQPVGTAQKQFEKQQRMQQLAQGAPVLSGAGSMIQDGNIVSDAATGAAALTGAVFGAKSGAALGTAIDPGIGTIM